MWFISRPDATNVWKNEEVIRRYQRYRDILDGKKTARYLIAKSIPVDITLDKPLDELWKAHEKASVVFNTTLEKIDSNKMSINEITKPTISFVELKEKIAYEMLKACHFCERRCKTDRSQGETGHCKLGKESYISSAFLHTGEESVLVPSGTIFFTGCTFNCVFCQNHDISQGWCDDKKHLIGNHLKVDGEKVSALAERLWKDGAKNINLVGGDPTPNLHTIISALRIFDKNITILWNSNMYQSLEATTLLLELIDFWLPDLKFWKNNFAEKMSGINNYREVVTRNIKMAYEKGSGEILIRHLIMPGRVEEDTYPILKWCATEIPKSMVNLMDQYHPDHLVRSKPASYSSINRRITQTEWQNATKKADELEIFWHPVS